MGCHWGASTVSTPVVIVLQQLYVSNGRVYPITFNPIKNRIPLKTSRDGSQCSTLVCIRVFLKNAKNMPKAILSYLNPQNSYLNNEHDLGPQSYAGSQEQ